MEYLILGNKIHFSEEQMNWFEVINLFNQIEEHARQVAREKYSQYTNLKDLSERFPDDCMDIAHENIVKPAASYLNKHKIYTVSEDTLGSKLYTQYDETIEKAVRKYIKEFDKIEFKKEDKSIGILEASAQRNNVLKDKEIFNELLLNISIYCWKVRSCCIDYLEEANIMCEELDAEDRHNAFAICNNVENGTIPKEDIRECIVKALQLDPFNEPLYLKAMEEGGDSDKEIERMGKDFGFDIVQAKEEYIKKIYQDKKIVERVFSEKQENDLLNLKQQIIDSCKWLGLENCEYVKILDDKWEMLDTEIRTVEGVTYDTREKAQQIKQDISLFEEYTSKQNYDDINILDVSIYNNCVEDIFNLSYTTEEFRNTVKERAQLYLQRYMNHHITRKKLANPATFMAEFNNMICQTGFYRKNQKKMHFHDYANDKKNSAPAITTYKGTPILYQENPKLMERSRGIVYTTQEVVVYDKKNLSIIPLSDIDTVRFSEEGNFQVISKNGVLDFGTLSGIDNKELREEYTRVMDSIIYALSKLEIKPQIVTIPVNRVEPVLQQTNISNVNMQQLVYAQNANNVMGNTNQPKKEKGKSRIVLIVVAAIGAIAFCLIVMFIVLIGLAAVVSEDTSQYSESTVIESTVLEENELSVMSSEEIPLQEEIPATEEIQTSDIDSLTEEIMNVEESVYTGNYDYLQDFTYIYDVYEGAPVLNSYEEYEPFYKEQYERWMSGEDYSYIRLDVYGKLYVDWQLYDSPIEYVGTWWDEDSQRCNMTITESGEGYMIDIMWSNSAYETVHWSYYGEFSDEENYIYCTQGCMFYEITMDNGEIMEGLEYADGTATLWLDSDGILYWIDDVRNSGDSCYFKKSSGIY